MTRAGYASDPAMQRRMIEARKAIPGVWSVGLVAVLRAPQKFCDAPRTKLLMPLGIRGDYTIGSIWVVGALATKHPSPWL